MGSIRASLLIALVAAGLCLVGTMTPAQAKEPSAVCVRADLEATWALASGDVESALEFAVAATEADPDCAAAWLLLGKVHAGKNQWAQAAKAFANAQKLWPDRVDIRLLLAEALLAQQKTSWALRFLKPAQGKGGPAEQARWQYLMGIASLQGEDANAALDYFAAIPDDAAGRFARLDYFRAEAHLLLKQNDAAEPLLAHFVDANQSDDPFANAAEKRLNRIRMAHVSEDLIRFSANLSLLWDSNVVQQPDDQPAGTPSPSSFGLSLGAVFSVAPLRLPQHVLALDLSAQRTFYFEDPANDFAPTSGALSPRYTFNWRRDKHHITWSSGYTGAVVALDGGALAEEDSFYVYSEQHAGWSRLVYRLDGFGESSLRIQGGHTWYHHQGRDNDGVNATLGQSFFFLDQRLKLFANVIGRAEWARRDDYDRYGIGGFAGLSGLAPWELNLAGWVRYEYLNHPKSGDSLVWIMQRQDHLLRAGLSISRPVLDWLSIGVDYGLTLNRSTLDAYDYARHTVMVTLTGRVAWSPK